VSASLSEQAYQQIRQRIIRLDLAPGDVLREHELQERLEIGRTPIREALQRLAREHFIQVIPRRGMFVTSIDVAELSTLLETRFVLEPYAARLAAARGNEQHWDAMASELDAPGLEALPPGDLLAADRRCHEIMWQAAANRFLLDTLDMLYAQSDRLWHLYLSDVTEMSHAVTEHRQILDALRSGEGDRVAHLMEQHIHAFDERIRDAVTAHLTSPLAG
jgi:DNA-binding GntR family transcriptional regulator